MKIKKKFFLFILFFFLFLNSAYSQEFIPNKYNLSINDITYIRVLLTDNEPKNILELPFPENRPSVSKYFRLLRNQNSEEWVGAYLFLLTIVPQLFIEDEIGC